MREITPTEGQRIDDRPMYLGLHRPFIPNDTDQIDGYIEAAHAASEIDDEPGVSPSWSPYSWSELSVFVFPAVTALALFALLAVVHFWRAA